MSFDGLGMHLGNLARLSRAETRSLSAENPTGAKGQGGMAINPEHVASRELGQGWKVRPCIGVKPGETAVLADIAGPGAIQQIWMTPTGNYRFSILRIYWDHETTPSVECPVGDFFASAYTSFNVFRPVVSLPVCVNPGNAFNCYWEMPFRKHCRITLENIGSENMTEYYQINYTLTPVPDDAAYFHAQFRRVNPLPYKSVYTILDGVKGWGHYVGTYMAWGVNNNGWWGEGEIKFFLDGDKAFPTICGTGTEDYFCGSYNFENHETKKYQTFSTAHSGLAQVLPPDAIYVPVQRFGLYRWHVADPVCFKKDLKVTIQTLGWMADKSGRYLPLKDDVASVAYWYQTEPHAPFPALPAADVLKVGPLQVVAPQK
jgi:hypothetical protein